MTEKNFPLSLSFFGLMEVIWINQGNDRNYRWRNLGTRHPLITTSKPNKRVMKRSLKCLKLEAPEMAKKPLLCLPINAQLVSNL